MLTKPVFAFAASLILLVQSTTNGGVVETWHSYNATIRSQGAASGLTRGDIVGDQGTNSPLKFYLSTNAYGVNEAATAGGLTGLHRTNSVGGNGDFIDEAGGWWALPGGQSGIASDLSSNSGFAPYVGKSDVARAASEGSDNTVATLPGGTAGVFDLVTHPPVSSDRTAVITFTAPYAATYRISDFAARALHNSTGSQGRQSAAIIDDRSGTDILTVITAGGDGAGGPAVGSRYMDWVIDPGVYTLDLLAGEEIHFAVHNGLFGPDSDNWAFDNTEIAFTISAVVPEPTGLVLVGLGLVCGQLSLGRRRRSRGNLSGN